MARVNQARLLAERHEETVYNLLECWERSTAAERETGLSWYPRNVDGTYKWAETFGIDYRTVACVIAALSPQANWPDNLRSALSLLSGDAVPLIGGVLNRSVDIARRVIADGATSLEPYYKAGPKVCNFARNLQGDGMSVTVDSHAAQAALDTVLFTAVRPTIYQPFVDAYRDAARTVGVRPCDFQAVVWHVWKRENPPASKRATRRHGGQ